MTETPRRGLKQDPHATREALENSLEQAIGHEVRAYRKKMGVTVADLAAATGMSLGMLSKIENGNISPSLAIARPFLPSIRDCDSVYWTQITFCS